MDSLIQNVSNYLYFEQVQPLRMCFLDVRPKLIFKNKSRHMFTLSF